MITLPKPTDEGYPIYKLAKKVKKNKHGIHKIMHCLKNTADMHHVYCRAYLGGGPLVQKRQDQSLHWNANRETNSETNSETNGETNRKTSRETYRKISKGELRGSLGGRPLDGLTSAHS
ncbi:hypothetical protein MBLNU457_g1064t1 [Dothideomycetes sp. NU457]